MPFALAVLALAILVEVGASALLPKAEGFTNPGWTAVVVAGYLLAIWLLTVVVKKMDVSIAYAIWSGVGTAAIAIIGYFWLGESMTPIKVAGIALIVVGVVALNLNSAQAA
ncbi:MAG: multidrug efflux SMR transporter [Propionibacteriales bacterium]|nr:multidrug efflux SMR transporter [Propionibacteriales bacterium]